MIRRINQKKKKTTNLSFVILLFNYLFSDKSLSPNCPTSQQALDNIRRYRTAFTREQIGMLEKEFMKENYISRPKRCELANELNLPENTIKVILICICWSGVAAIYFIVLYFICQEGSINLNHILLIVKFCVKSWIWW